MARRAYVGIDSGTQSTKAIVCDADDGALLGLGRGEHPPLDLRDGRSEQHPDLWVEAATEAVRLALADAAAAHGTVDVAGIGVSGQQHGLVCLDEADRPVRPAKLWNDTTTAADGLELEQRLGGREAVLALTGNLFLAGYTAPAVAWLRRTDPEAWARTRRVCLPHDYLNLWLTGEFATEPGDASGTAYFDPAERRYESRILRALDPDRDWEAVLPPVRPSLSVVGRVRADVAERTGLPAGAPVSAGGGDNMCAAIGAGVTETGVAMVSLGTSGTVSAHSDEPRVDPGGEAAAFCDSTGGWLPLACTFNCTAAIDWLRGILDLALDEAEQLAAQTAPGAAGLTFLPYLTGERTPQRAPAEGRLVGLGTSHGRPEIIRAVFEGVTFSLLYAWRAVARTGVAASEIVLVGGGSASAAWGRLVADAIGVPVGTLARPEAAATGAALQARWTVDGRRPDRPPPAQRWEPDPHPALLAAIERWDRLRDATTPAPAALSLPGGAARP